MIINKVRKSIVLVGFTIAITSIFMITVGNNVFAQQFYIFKIEEYGIQFQTPIDWSVTKKHLDLMICLILVLNIMTQLQKLL